MEYARKEKYDDGLLGLPEEDLYAVVKAVVDGWEGRDCRVHEERAFFCSGSCGKVWLQPSLGRFASRMGAGPRAMTAAGNMLLKQYYHSGTASPQKIGTHYGAQVV